MEAEALKEKFMLEHGILEIHPLHSLILDECCENASELGEPGNDNMSTAIAVAFLSSFSGLKAVIEQGLREYDRVKIVYRGEQFFFVHAADPALDISNINFFRHPN